MFGLGLYKKEGIGLNDFLSIAYNALAACGLLKFFYVGDGTCEGEFWQVVFWRRFYRCRPCGPNRLIRRPGSRGITSASVPSMCIAWPIGAFTRI